MEHFGEESDSLEVSKGGCGCQSCEALGGTKVNIKDDAVLGSTRTFPNSFPKCPKMDGANRRSFPSEAMKDALAESRMWF